MSDTSSDEQWDACGYCGEIVQLSADPRIPARYHAAACPTQANPQISTVSVTDGPSADTASASNTVHPAAEFGDSDGVWLTGGPAQEPAVAGGSAGRFLPQAGPAPEAGRPVGPPAGNSGPPRRLRLWVSLGLAAVLVIAGVVLGGLHVGGTTGREQVDRKPSLGPSPGIAAPDSSAPSAALSRGRARGPANSAPAGSGGATRPGATVPGSGQAPPSVNCTTSVALGNCGPYSYPQVTGMTAVSGISLGNNVWNPVSGWAQTLRSASPGDWSVTARMPSGNTTVVSYPSLQADYIQSTSTAVPLSHYASIYSAFSETMNATSGTSAWATYEISIGQGSDKSPVADVMIENDLADGSGCSSPAAATFGGSGGVPVQTWNLCKFGTELAWELRGGNEQSGTVNVLAMVNWLVSHGDLPSDAGLFSISYGWQIVSTGGQNENFQVSRFSVTASPS